MKLLEILPQLAKYGRAKRRSWRHIFLIKPIYDFEPMIVCDLNSMILEKYFITFSDLISDDWEFVE